MTTLYAGLASAASGKRHLHRTAPRASTGFVPIVLDVSGLAHYTSELQLTNLGASSTTVKLSYTSSIGSGTGDVQETIPAGQQVVYPDAISYLRIRGVPIPASGNQGGTLLLSAPAAGVRATVRTGADTVAPQPVGRAGLAYTRHRSGRVFVGHEGVRLRPEDERRRPLQPGRLQHGRRPRLAQGHPRLGRRREFFRGDGWCAARASGLWLVPVLRGPECRGFSSGYAIVERVSGSGPFGAYGVVNDQMTNDGSFIPALSGTLSGSKLTIPVLVETNAFESELILTNRGSATATFTLRYVESLSPAKGPGGTTTVDVAAGRQMIIPNAIDFLRSKGVGIGARGEASYAGSLQVQVSGVGSRERLRRSADVVALARRRGVRSLLSGHRLEPGVLRSGLRPRPEGRRRTTGATWRQSTPERKGRVRSRWSSRCWTAPRGARPWGSLSR